MSLPTPMNLLSEDLGQMDGPVLTGRKAGLRQERANQKKPHLKLGSSILWEDQEKSTKEVSERTLKVSRTKYALCSDLKVGALTKQRLVEVMS